MKTAILDSGDPLVIAALLNHAALIQSPTYEASPEAAAGMAVMHAKSLLRALGQPAPDLKARVAALEQTLREILPLAGLKDATHDEWKAFKDSIIRANALLGGGL